MFLIGTISLFKTIQFVKTTDVEIMDTSVKISTSELNYGGTEHIKEATGNRYELEVALEDKVYPETY